MNSFLKPHSNGPSLTGIIDVTAHSISLFQENEPPKEINDIFIPNSDISIAEPYGDIIDELGNNVITMYQFIGDINDTKVGGLESLLNYMNENFPVKMGQLLMSTSITLLKSNTMKKQLTFTALIKAKHLTLRIIHF